jgi:hypothetical protein
MDTNTAIKFNAHQMESDRDERFSMLLQNGINKFGNSMLWNPTYAKSLLVVLSQRNHYLGRQRCFDSERVLGIETSKTNNKYCIIYFICQIPYRMSLRSFGSPQIDLFTWTCIQRFYVFMIQIKYKPLGAPLLTPLVVHRSRNVHSL